MVQPSVGIARQRLFAPKLISVAPRFQRFFLTRFRPEMAVSAEWRLANQWSKAVGAGMSAAPSTDFRYEAYGCRSISL